MKFDAEGTLWKVLQDFCIQVRVHKVGENAIKLSRKMSKIRNLVLEV